MRVVGRIVALRMAVYVEDEDLLMNTRKDRSTLDVLLLVRLIIELSTRGTLPDGFDRLSATLLDIQKAYANQS